MNIYVYEYLCVFMYVYRYSIFMHKNFFIGIDILALDILIRDMIQ